MSYGLPCLVSDISGNRDLHINGNRFFAPGNSNDLATKIQKVIHEESKSARDKRHIKVIDTEYNWESISSRTLTVYLKAFSNGI